MNARPRLGEDASITQVVARNRCAPRHRELPRTNAGLSDGRLPFPGTPVVWPRSLRAQRHAFEQNVEAAPYRPISERTALKSVVAKLLRWRYLTEVPPVSRISDEPVKLLSCGRRRNDTRGEWLPSAL